MHAIRGKYVICPLLPMRQETIKMIACVWERERQSERVCVIESGTTVSSHRLSPSALTAESLIDRAQ